MTKKKQQAAKKPKINYSEHMKQMPEFKQEELKPIKQLLVNFATKEDMHKFAKLVGQPITAQTRMIFYPELKEEPMMDKRWSR